MAERSESSVLERRRRDLPATLGPVRGPDVGFEGSR